LWSSYKVITQYQLVDNNKIIKNSEKIFNWFLSILYIHLNYN
jgi:hypothetical protein